VVAPRIQRRASCGCAAEKCRPGGGAAARRHRNSDLLEEIHVGELDTLARLVESIVANIEELAKDVSARGGRHDSWRTAWEGISVNTRTERRVEPCWRADRRAGGLWWSFRLARRPISDSRAGLRRLVASLRLLARLTPPLEGETRSFAGNAARADSRRDGGSQPRSVCMILSSVSSMGPPERTSGRKPYFLRLLRKYHF